MLLRMFTLTLAPPNNAPVPAQELRSFFTGKFSEYKAGHADELAAFIHRYPAVQVKIIDGAPLIIGINEGADFLSQTCDGPGPILAGGTAWKITSRDATPCIEEFGSSERVCSYEFATPWLGLNQENFRKFYRLNGKPERDAFIRKMLEESILTLAKSLGCPVLKPVRCTVNLHFQRTRQDGAGTMAFTGKFTADFRIPEYLGIGQSAGHGFGAVRNVPGNPMGTP